MRLFDVDKLPYEFCQLESRICDIMSASDGKHFLPGGVFYNVESYETTGRLHKRYESHKRYIDIQIILEGTEVISVKDTSELDICEVYDIKKDIMFYHGNSHNTGEEIILKPGMAAVFMPNDGHMPGISIDEECDQHVRKAVIKIPYYPRHNVKYLVMDVDGTLTDGKVYLSSDGVEMKAFNIKDGYGLNVLVCSGKIRPILITGRDSSIVERRADELGISMVFQGVSDKLGKLKEITSDMRRIAYIGDDLNDYDCLRSVKELGGVTGCPADAVEDIRNLVDFVAPHNGGDGAVRDFIEWICDAITENNLESNGNL